MGLVGLLIAVSLVFSTPLTAEPLGRAVPRLMREGDVPGVSIAVIRDRRVSLVRAFGVSDAEARAPLARDAVFEAASLGKPVFAYAVLRLADRGVLSLDVPLAQYLDEPVSDPRMKRITARMVLTHTTGYQNEVMPGETLRVHFEPGSRFSYSGAGFLHLQRAVEARTGKPLVELMQELVFTPLGMRDSGYLWRPDHARRKVYGHTAAGRRNERRRPAAATVATLHTTAGDYARFVVALMNGTGLKAETAAAMIAAQTAVDASRPMCLSACSGAASMALWWGLGVGIEKTADGTAFWHWGENHGDTHTFMMGRGDGSGVVVLTNSGNGHSIMPELVSTALAGDHPAFAWMGYESYRAPSRRILRDLLAGAAPGDGALDALTEQQINRIGYALLERNRIAEAVAVFRTTPSASPGPPTFTTASAKRGCSPASAGTPSTAIAARSSSIRRTPTPRRCCNGSERSEPRIEPWENPPP